MSYYGTVSVVPIPGDVAVNRPFWGCSSTATSSDAGSGTTGLWWTATNIDLLGKGAASSSSSFDHITAPMNGPENIYYDINLQVLTATTGQLYIQRWPRGSTTATIQPIFSSGGDCVLNKWYQLKLPVSPGEEFTVGMTAAASSGQFSLYINRSMGI
jgi:hypothetical protein